MGDPICAYCGKPVTSSRKSLYLDNPPLRAVFHWPGCLTDREMDLLVNAKTHADRVEIFVRWDARGEGRVVPVDPSEVPR